MTIRQITDRLNEKAKTEGFQIADLPELRKKYLDKKQLPNMIFTAHTVFERYAFHHGGRDEMQFNIGNEELDDDKIFSRYALCFSLEASHSLPDPVGDLEPFRKRFNQCIETHPDFFSGFKMWYYQNGERYGNFSTQKIPDEWFQRNTFICIGNIIEKPLAELDDIDLTEILNGFDNLLPIYQYCVLQSPSVLSKEKRIARFVGTIMIGCILQARTEKAMMQNPMNEKEVTDMKNGYLTLKNSLTVITTHCFNLFKKDEKHFLTELLM